MVDSQRCWQLSRWKYRWVNILDLIIMTPQWWIARGAGNCLDGSTGEVDKYKACLVVKGYAQRKGIDYNELYALVARWDTVRSIVAIAAQKGWDIFQLDVKSAFLNGELKETVFVEQPPGFIEKGEENKLCERFKSSMMLEFEMSNLGKMKYFLGVEVEQTSEGIKMHQKKYAKEVLERFNMWEGNGVKNPIVPGTNVTKTGDKNKVDGSFFKSLVGKPRVHQHLKPSRARAGSGVAPPWPTTTLTGSNDPIRPNGQGLIRPPSFSVHSTTTLSWPTPPHSTLILPPLIRPPLSFG
ncbi:hypothetical protein E3N88_40719 [Mikania micrantha]|uniref:Reverse transcriptase Ty1/copia-type domain-containing protein n=1 Tax=Mikania micrantha TaxID=192012 RepID=A0A5N6LND5_9ASTR|nr:hypothetical protein E3N88_40719 [Mikania micrantha]